MKTQSVGLSPFRVTCEPKQDGFLFALTSEEGVRGPVYHVARREMAIKDNKIPESSFTIEALPAGTKGVDCFGNHTHLEPYSCKGEITIY